MTSRRNSSCWRSCWLVLSLVLGDGPGGLHAFRPPTVVLGTRTTLAFLPGSTSPLRPSPQHQLESRRRSGSPSSSSSSSILRRMSDVPQDPDNDDPTQKLFPRLPRLELPPAPEDQFVLIGDLLSLFLYSFSDHFVCQDLASFFLPGSSTDSVALDQALGGHQPVWLDATSSYHSHVLHVLLHDATVTQYSPLLQPTGLAACALASCWLLAGWWHRAFLYQNTLRCSTPHTLRVTARAWFTACLILTAAVGMSSYALTGTSYEYWWQAYTRGDLDYIWDSLTVLCVWRYMASSMLGSGEDDDD